MNPYGGLWSGISASVGQTLGLIGGIYANQSGLTAQQLEAANAADARRTEANKKYAMYAVIGLVAIVLLILIIRKK